jgi:hypothetical protein
MHESDSHSLREELARLEAEETLVSAQRRRLHQQIDFGYASGDVRARERQVSDRRLELHRRIDELRELLGDGGYESFTEPAPDPEPSLAERLAEGPTFRD